MSGVMGHPIPLSKRHTKEAGGEVGMCDMLSQPYIVHRLAMHFVKRVDVNRQQGGSLSKSPVEPHATSNMRAQLASSKQLLSR